MSRQFHYLDEEVCIQMSGVKKLLAKAPTFSSGCGVFQMRKVVSE
jgi:hypothetical protein